MTKAQHHVLTTAVRIMGRHGIEFVVGDQRGNMVLPPTEVIHWCEDRVGTLARLDGTSRELAAKALGREPQ